MTEKKKKKTPKSASVAFKMSNTEKAEVKM